MIIELKRLRNLKLWVAGFFVLVSFGATMFLGEDAEAANCFDFVGQPTGNGYYKASLGSRKKGHILLHRLIMKPPDHMVVDHIDGDKTNCRKSNLRICSQAENSRNARISKNNCCGKKGVHYDARRKRWYARIHKGLTYSLGGYESCDSAARAYDAAAEELHGEYSKTNKELGLLGGSG